MPTETAANPASDAPPVVGATQRRVLELVKRAGRLTLAGVVGKTGLALGTVREHMQALAAQGLVEQVGTRRRGPGRPELVFAVTPAGHAVFPQSAEQVLSEFVQFLLHSGREETLTRFFDHRLAHRTAAAERRLEGKTAEARLEEISRIMTEEGYMAVVESNDGGADPHLRLCHCPLRDIVVHTSLPCRMEVSFIERLLGRPLERTRFMPDGDASCSYRICAPTKAP